METRASHVIVGFFVVLLTVATAVFALWLARAQLDRQVDVYEIAFATSVAGLQNGAQVTYQGIQVGRVSRISFDPNNIDRVVVRIEVEPTTPITDATVGRLQPQGITGVFNVQLSSSRDGGTPLPSRPNDPAQIPGAPSTLDRLTADAPELLTRGVLLLERASLLLSDDNVARIQRMLEDVEILTDSIASRSAAIEALIDDSAGLVGDVAIAAQSAQTTLERLDDVASTLQNDVDGLLAAGTESMTELTAAAQQIEQASSQFAGLARDIREPARDFAEGGLYELDALIGESRQLIAAMTRITREFERDPAGFLLGGSFKGFQAE